MPPTDLMSDSAAMPTDLHMRLWHGTEPRFVCWLWEAIL